jgi:hypothetical protein
VRPGRNDRVIAMSNNDEKRLGGHAGDGMNVSQIIREAIKNTTRADHGIDTAAVKYGQEPVAHFHQGEIVNHLHQGEIARQVVDTAVQKHDPEADRDTR